MRVRRGGLRTDFWLQARTPTTGASYFSTAMHMATGASKGASRGRFLCGGSRWRLAHTFRRGFLLPCCKLAQGRAWLVWGSVAVRRMAACITSAWAYATGDETGAVLLAGDERRTQQLRMAVAAAASSLLTVG